MEPEPCWGVMGRTWGFHFKSNFRALIALITSDSLLAGSWLVQLAEVLAFELEVFLSTFFWHFLLLQSLELVSIPFYIKRVIEKKLGAS